MLKQMEMRKKHFFLLRRAFQMPKLLFDHLQPSSRHEQLFRVGPYNFFIFSNTLAVSAELLS